MFLAYHAVDIFKEQPIHALRVWLSIFSNLLLASLESSDAKQALSGCTFLSLPRRGVCVCGTEAYQGPWIIFTPSLGSDAYLKIPALQLFAV